ncbi:MAG: Asp-tRNA(Asn)/Glu-tRNA(Gln) amidotransferase subunit GatC [Bernardetiaceae bacterium]
MNVTIDKKLLDDIAHLSRLEFTDPAEEEKMRDDLNEILQWIEKLDQLDTSHVEPLIHIGKHTNVVRPDATGTHLDHERGLQNAPKRDSNYFRVPRVMD